MSFSKYLIGCSWLLTVVLAQQQQQQQQGPPQPSEKFERIKTAHAVLGSVAWVFFLPLGAILVRLLNGRTAVYAHAGIQLFATTLIISSVGMGIWAALNQEEISQHHCIIGLVVFSLLFFQILGGILHHLYYRKHGRKTVVSHLHIWMGRALITLGMINGGLGLDLSSDGTRGDYIAYGVIAGVIWVTWLCVDIGVLFKKRDRPNTPADKREKHGL